MPFFCCFFLILLFSCLCSLLATIIISNKQASNSHQVNESEEIGETLVKVLTSINRRTSSTETKSSLKHKIMIE